MNAHLNFVQAAVKGSYTPLADTLKQVDSITKDDVVKVSLLTRPTVYPFGLGIVMRGLVYLSCIFYSCSLLALCFLLVLR